ncbi:MAG: glycosyltransferase family 4 protein [Gemmatimonadales bacterium]|nr:glycosyltransferase family 4 protein [Gemmatimonadales bacterium]
MRVIRYLWLFESRRPDAVLLLSANGGSFVEKALCSWYGRLRGARTLLFIRAGAYMEEAVRSGLARRMNRLLLGGADMLLCQGPTWQSFFQREFGIPTARCPVVPNWTAAPDYIDSGRRRSYTEVGTVNVLFMGWLKEAKGVFDLLEAVKLVSESTAARVVLHLYGEGSESGRAREWVRVNRMESTVVFHGWVRGDEKRRAFESAEVFALPSHAEGLPNAMIEAMSMGLPIIATPVGSVPDAVRDEVEGLLVPPRDVRRLAAAIGRVASSSSLRERLGRAALSASERYSLEGAVSKIVAAVKGDGGEAGDLNEPGITSGARTLLPPAGDRARKVQ